MKDTESDNFIENRCKGSYTNCQDNWGYSTEAVYDQVDCANQANANPDESLLGAYGGKCDCGDDEFDMRDVLLLDCTALRIREAAEDMGIILLFFLFPSFLSFFGLTTSIFHCERRWERSMRLWYLGKKKERERERE